MMDDAGVISLRRHLAEVYPAVAESVPHARQTVSDYAARVAGIRGDGLDAVKTAVTEAVTNAVRHAYREGTPGDVSVTAGVAEGELWVLVADDGCGYRTAAQNPGLGCGLALIAASTEDFVVSERAQGGTEVRMRFPLAAGEPALG